jgi:hypothetical protein
MGAPRRVPVLALDGVDHRHRKFQLLCGRLLAPARFFAGVAEAQADRVLEQGVLERFGIHGEPAPSPVGT